MTQAEPTSCIVNLCLDANDPPRLAHFWAAALGWELGESDGEVALIPTDDTRFGILFEPIAEQKVGQNNIHLDLTTTSIVDQNGLVERLIGLGARHVDVGQHGDEGHVVLADPEGNEFCIIGPDNNFLAGCGRLERSTPTELARWVCSGARRSAGHWSGIRIRKLRSVRPTAPVRSSNGADRR